MAEIKYKYLGISSTVIPGDVEDDGLVDVLEHLRPLTDLACAQAVWTEPQAQLDISCGSSLSRWNLEYKWIQSYDSIQSLFTLDKLRISTIAEFSWPMCASFRLSTGLLSESAESVMSSVLSAFILNTALTRTLESSASNLSSSRTENRKFNKDEKDHCFYLYFFGMCPF